MYKTKNNLPRMKKSEVSIVASIIIFLAIVAIVILGTTSKIPNFFRDKLGIVGSNLDLEEEKDDKKNLEDVTYLDSTKEYKKIIKCLSDRSKNFNFNLDYADYDDKKIPEQTEQVLKLLHPKARTRIYTWLKSVNKINPEISVQLKLFKKDNSDDQKTFENYVSNKNDLRAINKNVLENLKIALKNANFFYYEAYKKSRVRGADFETQVLHDPPNKKGQKILNLEKYGWSNRVKKNNPNKLEDLPNKNVDCSKNPNKCWCGVQIK